MANISLNSFLEVIEVERELFTKVRAMSLSMKLVKNQTEVKKYWPLPLVAARAEEGSFVVPIAQIGELSGTGSILRVSHSFL